jgi:Arc/MetJ family transcription regulator
MSYDDGKRDNMVINVAVDDDMIHTAIELGGSKSEEDTVNMALEEFIRHKRRMEFLSVAGTIDFDDDWNYRKLRGKV